MDKTWKAVERRGAKLFGTRRNPLSGINSGVTGSDTRHEKFYFEFKHGASTRISPNKLLELMVDTETKAAGENKTPIVVLHKKFSREMDCYLRYKDLVNLVNGYGEGMLVRVSADDLAKIV